MSTWLNYASYFLFKQKILKLCAIKLKFMQSIKFGTDGWRAIIADDYTVANVLRVSEATAIWLRNQGGKKVVIGHDCRFGGEMFLQQAASVFASHGIQALVAKNFVSTPMVSFGVVKTGSDLGIVITASHNPPSYNGFKLKSSFGGPTIPSDIAAVESLIPDNEISPSINFENAIEQGLVSYVELEKMYIDHIKENFDLVAIQQSGLKMAYDGMYGAGQNVIKTLFANSLLLHCEYNPSFMGQAPEPIHRNLLQLSNAIRSSSAYAFGLANDGDADRIGMYDGDGNFVDSHHLLLLLLLYLHKYKGLSGEVIITFSVTDKMKKLAEIFGLPCTTTKIGFKYIAEIMITRDVLVGGEESGGLAVKGHIPERDGIWVGLMIMEFMAKTGKSLKELIQEVYDLVGPFATDRYDLHITETKKSEVISACQQKLYQKFGTYTVVQTENLDGFKFYFDADRWVMIRPSGTEPVLRVYSQAPNHAEAIEILEQTKEAILA